MLMLRWVCRGTSGTTKTLVCTGARSISTHQKTELIFTFKISWCARIIIAERLQTISTPTSGVTVGNTLRLMINLLFI